MSGFTDRPIAAVTADGKHLNLRHGPIELWINAVGEPGEVAKAYRQASDAFQSVLPDLVCELALLRRPVSATVPEGPVARQMHGAVLAHADHFITPMAAVAGAVADYMLSALVNGRDLRRAHVNNGGDIALYLPAMAEFDIGICANPVLGTMAGSIKISSDDTVRGVATSGWRGRSHSLGIADAVTVLAKNAATADAAATMIANEVTLDSSPNVRRLPASELSPDSDLGDRMVTVAVDRLTPAEVRHALERGEDAANAMLRRGLIVSAFVCLGGAVRITGEKQMSTQTGTSETKPKAALEELNA